MIRVFHPGSGYPDPDFLPIPDPGVKKAPDPQHSPYYMISKGSRLENSCQGNSSRAKNIFTAVASYIFFRFRVYWPLLCLCRPFMIFEECLDSNPEVLPVKLPNKNFLVDARNNYRSKFFPTRKNKILTIRRTTNKFYKQLAVFFFKIGSQVQNEFFKI
jgi:hypothetical protein